MSGGYFDYLQFRLSDMEDEIEKLINSNEDESLNEWIKLHSQSKNLCHTNRLACQWR